MKLLKYLFLLLIAGSCCRETPQTHIEGFIDDKYDGEWLYLVPLHNPTAQTVDSVKISNGRFSFHKPADSINLHILRLRPILRLKVEELLVVLEPGSFSVRLDSVSRAVGTDLNDRLQQWKDHKREVDRRISRIKKSSQNMKDLEIEMKDSIEMIRREASLYNRKFIQENNSNILGDLLRSYKHF